MGRICRCTDEYRVAVSAKKDQLNVGQELRGDALRTATASPAYDVVFIGAGISTSYSLLHLLADLQRLPGPGIFRFGIVERSADTFCGVPYGERSSHTSLLITALRDFLPDAERALFRGWLTANKHWVFDSFRTRGGALSAHWLRVHHEAIAHNDWDDLYLPRYIFGLYMDERVRATIANGHASGHVLCDVLQHEAVDLRHDDAGYLIEVADRDGPIRSRHVVLAVGTPPNRSMLAAPPGADDTAVCLVEDPYVPSLTAALARITARLESHPAVPHVLLIGGNATTMDVLYTMNGFAGLSWGSVRFHIVTPSGHLPDRFVDAVAPTAFVPAQLRALVEDADPTARAVYEAARRDLAQASRDGLGPSDTLAPISEAVAVLMRLVPPHEKQAFAQRWGVELGRLQRRAGPEYSDLAERLAAEGRLFVRRGRFKCITAIDDSGAQVAYECDGTTMLLPDRLDVIVNCGGFARIDELPEHEFLRRIVDRGTCHLTASGAGIAVNDVMEANDGLFVMGPLLAGNVVAGTPIWHLEHCGRISTSSASLARTLAERLRRPAGLRAG